MCLEKRDLRNKPRILPSLEITEIRRLRRGNWRGRRRSERVVSEETIRCRGRVQADEKHGVATRSGRFQVPGGCISGC